MFPTLTIDALDWDDRIDSMLAQLGGDIQSKPIKVAIRRAITKTTKWLRRQITRIVAAEFGIRQKTFDKYRVSVRMREGELWEALLWVGTNPFPAHHLGVVRWTRRMKGARAGRRLFEGTFAHRSEGPIFRRSGEDRLPIEVEAVEIDAVLREQLRRLETQAMRRYRTLLAQELNYQLVKTRGAL